MKYIVSVLALFMLLTGGVAHAGLSVDELKENQNLLNQSRRMKALKHLHARNVDDETFMARVSKTLTDMDIVNLSRRDRKEAIFLIRILGNAKHKNYIETLKKYSAINDNRLEKEANKSIERIEGYLDRRKEYETFKETLSVSGASLDLYHMMLASSHEYTRDNAKYFLYSGRAISKPKGKGVSEFIPLELDLTSIHKGLDSGDLRSQKIAFQSIYYYSLHDATLFEKVSGILSNEFERFEQNGEANIDLLAWSAKALSASGDRKYRPILQKMADSTNEKLRFYGGYSTVALEKFVEWKTDVEKLAASEYISETELQFLVLRAPYLSIKDSALHYFFSMRQQIGDRIAAICFDEFESYYPYLRRNRQHVNAGVRMMHAMVLNPKVEYLPVMEAATQASSEHIQEHAKDLLKALRKRI